MFKVASGTEPTAKLITKIIERFTQRDVPRFQRLRKYYEVRNDITDRALPPEKPNNRIAHGFGKYITNMATGYFMGEGMRYQADDEEYQKNLNENLEQSATGDSSFEIAKEMSIQGISFELLYLSEKGEFRSKYFQAEEMIPVYSLSVGEFLEFAIRLYQEEDWETEKMTYYAEVYTKTEIITYRSSEQGGTYQESDRESHMMDDVPVIVYWNNEERKGDFEDVLSLIDAYDKAQSDTANDFEYFTDAYLVIIGADGGLHQSGTDGEEDEDKAIKTLKQERILYLDDKGQAQWLIKQINDTAVENFKNRVYSDIFFLAQVPALTDESFAGNLSGVAIRYKLIGLEQLAAVKESKFLAAHRKKLRMLTDWINTKYSRNYDAATVEVVFDRNVTDNLKELAELVALLDGKVSKETLLQLLPFIDDPKAEIKQLLAERAEEDDIPYVDTNQILIGAGADGE